MYTACETVLYKLSLLWFNFPKKLCEIKFDLMFLFLENDPLNVHICRHNLYYFTFREELLGSISFRSGINAKQRKPNGLTLAG